MEENPFLVNGSGPNCFIKLVTFFKWKENYKWKTTSVFLKMEDNPGLFAYGRRPHFCVVEVFQMEGKLKMEDDPNFFVKGRRPIILGK